LVHLRRRGTVIVDCPEGILVVSERGNRYSLPGGTARKGESRKKAAIRELQEETGLKVLDCMFLFEYFGSGIHNDVKGGYFKTAHKVFLVKTEGIAKPRKEVKHLCYFNGSNVTLHRSSRVIIELYQQQKIRDEKTSNES
jgi:8-oxo-dGTP pyrophosphatase MutT (NUDIX family)